MIHYQYKNSELLFVGINPHPGSLRRSVPFSNNKLFWYLLARAELIDEDENDLRDDEKLKEFYLTRFTDTYKLGLVNLIERPTPSIASLKKGEEIEGRGRIAKIIETHNPKLVCFIGKSTYQKYSGLKDADFGWQADIAAAWVFVMHTPLRGLASVRIEELKLIKQVTVDLNPAGLNLLFA